MSPPLELRRPVFAVRMPRKIKAAASVLNLVNLASLQDQSFGVSQSVGGAALRSKRKRVWPSWSETVIETARVSQN